VNGAYIICQYGEKVLMIKNSYKSYFTIPCGKIDRGESSLEAAQRELKEEVNLDFPLDRFTYIKQVINRTEYKEDHQFYYHVNIDSNSVEQIVPDGLEVTEANLMSKEEIINENIFCPVKNIIFEKIFVK